MQMNGLINAGPELLPYLEIMRSKPTGNIVRAKIPMKTFGDVFILLLLLCVSAGSPSQADPLRPAFSLP